MLILDVINSIPGFAITFSCGFNIIWRGDKAEWMSVLLNIPNFSGKSTRIFYVWKHLNYLSFPTQNLKRCHSILWALKYETTWITSMQGKKTKLLSCKLKLKCTKTYSVHKPHNWFFHKAALQVKFFKLS